MQKIQIEKKIAKPKTEELNKEERKNHLDRGNLTYRRHKEKTLTNRTRKYVSEKKRKPEKTEKKKNDEKGQKTDEYETRIKK